MDIKKYIKDIDGYPKEGIIFRDISPLMADGDAFFYVTEQIKKFTTEVGAEIVIGPEARGFIVGCPVATGLNLGFIPVRKPNKLPRAHVSVSYDLEYGSNELSIHTGDIKQGQKVIIVDDLLATGGTIKATIELVESQGAEVVGIAFIVELEDLGGRELIGDYNILSLVKY